MAISGAVALRRLTASTELNKESVVLAAAPIPSVASAWGEDRVRSFGIVSTFPPTSCGIATFSAALAAGLIADGASVDVVRCDPTPDLEDALVLASTSDRSPARGADPVDVLNATDVVIIQHEYGLYDGRDGDAILGLIDAVESPIVVVAHTVLSEPSGNQRFVLEQVCAAADVVVVMTETARARLLGRFDVQAGKVIVIPHGAATPAATPSSDPWRQTDAPPRLLTWGLIGPGKGIEWAIDALAEVGDVHPHPEYIVAGATHPKVRRDSGESYREMLIERAARSSSAAHITFDDTYRDLASLTALIRSADLVVLPYDSEDQVTSGVLVDAVAAGRPVVSTAFPHAVELLASGAGIVVPQRDPAALGAAIRSVVTDPMLAASMAAEARRLAPRLAWPAVAQRYRDLGTRLVAQRRLVAS
jgi:glycosyltransferase involved in cell wall biosynthesis